MAQQAVIPLREQSCPVHEKGKICMVCTDCDFQMVCVTCMATTHQRHGFIEIEEFVKTKKDSLQVLLTEVKDLESDIKERLQKTRAADEFISLNNNKVKSIQKGKAERMKCLIDKWLNESYQECDKLYADNYKIVNDTEKRFTNQLDGIVSVITRSEIALKTSSYEDVISLEEALLPLLNAEKPMVPVVREIYLSQGESVDMDATFGNLHTIEVHFELHRQNVEIEPEIILRETNNNSYMVLGDFGGKPVTMKYKLGSSFSDEDFLSEAQILRNLHHPNVIHLQGVIRDADLPAIVLEHTYMNLHGFLTNEMEGYPLSLLLDFSAQIASGMEYIASRRLIHTALMARNILMTNNTTVKVAEFSNAVQLEDDSEDFFEVTWQSKWESRWSAPEAFNEGIISVASDVWSFGVLVWEMIAGGSKPYPDQTNKDVYYHILCDDIELPPKPQQCPQYIYGVLQKCWNIKPKQRPTFQELGQFFNDILQTVTVTSITIKPYDEAKAASTNLSTASVDDTERLYKEKGTKTAYLSVSKTSVADTKRLIKKKDEGTKTASLSVSKASVDDTKRLDKNKDEGTKTASLSVSKESIDDTKRHDKQKDEGTKTASLSVSKASIDDTKRLDKKKDEGTKTASLSVSKESIDDTKRLDKQKDEGTKTASLSVSKASIDDTKRLDKKKDEGTKTASLSVSKESIDDTKRLDKQKDEGTKTASLSVSKASIDDTKRLDKKKDEGTKTASLSVSKASVDDTKRLIKKKDEGTKTASLSVSKASINDTKRLDKNKDEGTKTASLSVSKASVDDTKRLIKKKDEGTKTASLSVSKASVDDTKRLDKKKDEGTKTASLSVSKASVDDTKRLDKKKDEGTKTASLSMSKASVDDTKRLDKKKDEGTKTASLNVSTASVDDIERLDTKKDVGNNKKSLLSKLFK